MRLGQLATASLAAIRAGTLLPVAARAERPDAPISRLRAARCAATSALPAKDAPQPGVGPLGRIGEFSFGTRWINVAGGRAACPRWSCSRTRPGDSSYRSSSSRTDETTARRATSRCSRGGRAPASSSSPPRHGGWRGAAAHRRAGGERRAARRPAGRADPGPAPAPARRARPPRGRPRRPQRRRARGRGHGPNPAYSDPRSCAYLPLPGCGPPRRHPRRPERRARLRGGRLSRPKRALAGGEVPVRDRRGAEGPRRDRQGRDAPVAMGGPRRLHACPVAVDRRLLRLGAEPSARGSRAPASGARDPRLRRQDRLWPPASPRRTLASAPERVRGRADQVGVASGAPAGRISRARC